MAGTRRIRERKRRNIMNKIQIKDKPRDEWLELRKQGIGGSDASAILGLNPYCSAYQVYCDKLGLLSEQDDNEAMRQGRELEQYVADRFEEATGKKTRRCNFILASEKYPFMLANVDRLIVGEDAGLECKTTSVFNKSDFANGDVPPNYYVQCMHYMAVTGKSKWYLAVLVLNRGFYWFEIPRNEAEITALIQAEYDFWYNNVLAGKEPAPDGSEKAAEVIKQLYGKGNDDEVISLTGFESKLKRLDEIEQLSKTLEHEETQIKQEIQTEMKTATVGICGDKTVYWRNYSRNTVDSKRLRSEEPATYEAYLKPTSYRKFEVKGEKIS